MDILSLCTLFTKNGNCCSISLWYELSFSDCLKMNFGKWNLSVWMVWANESEGKKRNWQMNKEIWIKENSNNRELLEHSILSYSPAGSIQPMLLLFRWFEFRCSSIGQCFLNRRQKCFTLIWQTQFTNSFWLFVKKKKFYNKIII